MSKEIPFSQITIRTIGTESQKIKFVYPSIANNKQLMKNMKFVISDPAYDAKMAAFNSKKSYSENGVAKEALKESFAPVVTEPKIVEPIPTNEIIAPVIEGEAKTRKPRRTKAQIEADKLTASKSSVTA